MMGLVSRIGGEAKMTSLLNFSDEEATTCDSLLQELQVLWDDIGEIDLERDRMILQLKQKCLNVFRKKVNQERKHKANLEQSLAQNEVEVSKIISILGELKIPNQDCSSDVGRQKCTLKEQVSKIHPFLEDLRRRRDERAKEFLEVQLQIDHIYAKISDDIHSSSSSCPQANEQDLLLKRLGELKCQLLELQKEKNTRSQEVNTHIKKIYELCSILSIDYNEVLLDVHPSFVDAENVQPMSISNETLARLAGTINSLKQEKTHKLQKLRGLGSMLNELWKLMGISVVEQSKYDYVSSLISTSFDEVLGHGFLAMDVIDKVEHEVRRLNILKTTKMREFILKKHNKLEEIYRGAHMDFNSDASRQKIINIINSEKRDLLVLLSDLDNQIFMAQEQAAHRRDILERVKKWMFVCQEESWLEEYERDQNCYSASRGAHINLSRARKARILVNKIQSLLETLRAKVEAWETENGMCFLYDKKPLLETLNEYSIKRRQRDDERRRSRDHMRSREQGATEPEVLFGSKPSTLRQLPAKKPLGQRNLNLPGGAPVGHRFSTDLPRPVILSNGKENKDGKKKKDGNKVTTSIP